MLCITRSFSICHQGLGTLSEYKLLICGFLLLELLAVRAALVFSHKLSQCLQYLSEFVHLVWVLIWKELYLLLFVCPLEEETAYCFEHVYWSICNLFVSNQLLETYLPQTWFAHPSLVAEEPYWFWDHWVKGQGHHRQMCQNCFWSITGEGHNVLQTSLVVLLLVPCDKYLWSSEIFWLSWVCFWCVSFWFVELKSMCAICCCRFCNMTWDDVWKNTNC